MAEEDRQDSATIGAAGRRELSPREGNPGASPDLLTGLLSRQDFVQRLRQFLGEADLAPLTAMVVAINLDQFHAVNALHGSATGDQVLRATAERLRAAVREGDVVARIGADEFAVLVRSLEPSTAEAEAIAARLVQLVRQPIDLGDRTLHLGARAAALVLTPADRTEDDVLRDIDLAQRQAKVAGHGIVVRNPALAPTVMRRYALVEQLRQAVDEGQFVLHYQPIVRLVDRRMVGAEALLRWNHPSDGLVSSAAFLPALERSGLIVEVGLWVIREAVRQIETWHLLFGRHIVDWVGVNLSPRQLDGGLRLLATLRAIHESGFSLRHLRLEVSTRICHRKMAQLAELQRLGVGVAIDDFGATGLLLPRNLPLDLVKLDSELVAEIGHEDGERLLRGLLDIAGIYGAPIAACGIETGPQHDFLRQNGYSLGQGYLFSEPMDGALLGAYALTHAVEPGASPAPRLAG